ncbi:thymidine kinase [Streptomyces sp. ST2-7A]|uniref:thymidine kinase n=1 Tax=Streptomyces sp. ST2-7A TaxID=2907214 RepID=UPI001F228B49|nr:thymidine kinase [Streptomyces sp. ST2-7A]MCE7081260.1 thymidine kinase [Streptomyces sp. ST2-7A]
MAELAFYAGTMNCGKSTLALQIQHNRSARGLRGLIFTRDDRAGEGRLSSRLGLVTEAIETDGAFDFHHHLVRRLTAGDRVDHLIVDEAQFLSAAQVDQLARIVDDLGIDVFAFGITTDFRTRLFPGSQRLIELADSVRTLQVESLCWCGERATHNARTVDGRMVVEGELVVVGDVDGEPADGAGDRGAVGYEVLCRRHHRRRLTAASAGAARLSPDVLPVDPPEDPAPARPPVPRGGRGPIRIG